jgi:hypothetical protein
MRSRFVYGIAALLTLTGVYSCWCGTPMIWDGAYQLSYTLVQQKPYVYLTRFHTWFLWWPVVWASHYTSDLKLLSMAYGLPFLLAPVVGLLASWWFVRRTAPSLMIWAIFGICIAPLPGQIFIINDSVFQQHLFWPIYLAAFVPLTRPQKLLFASLVVFQFVHQIGLVLLLGATIAALLLAWRNPAHRSAILRRAYVFAGLTLAVGVKVFLTSLSAHRETYDSYAAHEFTWQAARDRWLSGVSGLPFRGLILMALASIFVFIHGAMGQSSLRFLRRGVAALAALLVLAGAARWVVWASDEHIWSEALDYRRWLVPLTVPWYALALLESLIQKPAATAEPGVIVPPRTDVLSFRAALGCGLASLFAAVIIIQSTLFASMTRRLALEVRRYPGVLIPFGEMTWTHHTPLSHWSTASYVLLLQGKTPAKLMGESQYFERLWENPPVVQLDMYNYFGPQPGPRGWFDLRPLIHSLPPTPYSPSTEPSIPSADDNLK